MLESSLIFTSESINFFFLSIHSVYRALNIKCIVLEASEGEGDLARRFVKLKDICFTTPHTLLSNLSLFSILCLQSVFYAFNYLYMTCCFEETFF